MKKLVICLISLCLFLCACTNKENKVLKEIVPSDFKDKLAHYSSYQPQNLHQYYYAYLDNNSYIYALNSVNCPDFYNDEIKTASLSIDGLILVNRKFYLEKNYVPNNLIKVSGVSYIKRENETMMIEKNTFDMYQQMEISAKQHNLNLVLFSAYRSYEKQLSLWTPSRVTGDKYLALPGFSEHQTGLAVDIGTTDSGLTLYFENTEAFQFLKKEAHKYGFILRYPKDKTDITGYAYEPWHFRYVGVEIATKIYEEDLTLEEYFFKYLELNS